MSDGGWIIVRNWDRFQHYGNREPVWIKLYTALNSDPDWLALSTALRGLLVTIWLEYARSRGQLSLESLQHCARYARTSHIESLSDAGYITIVASKPLALARSREVEVEEKKKRPAAHAPKAKAADNSEARSNVAPKDPATAIRKMIRNGVITDVVELTAEIAGYNLDQETADRLRGLLQ